VTYLILLLIALAVAGIMLYIAIRGDDIFPFIKDAEDCRGFPVEEEADYPKVFRWRRK
jgi:hypothetical protein